MLFRNRKSPHMTTRNFNPGSLFRRGALLLLALLGFLRLLVVVLALFVRLVFLLLLIVARVTVELILAIFRIADEIAPLSEEEAAKAVHNPTSNTAP